MVVPVVVTVYDDRSFDPGADGAIAKLGRAQLREVARTKLPDLNTDDLDTAERIVAGTARSMGIEVVDPG